MIDTRSTHDVGSTELARKIQARLLAAGFAPADAQLLIPADHPRAGNVVARLHGRGKGKPVLYLCHLDVVAANPEDWTRDPFHLTEDNGWLYGRGTIDMKGQDAAVARGAAAHEGRRISFRSATSLSPSPRTRSQAVNATASTGC